MLKRVLIHDLTMLRALYFGIPLAIVLGACADEPGVHGRFERLNLSRLDDSPGPPAVSVYMHMPVPEGLAPWECSAAKHKLWRTDDGSTLLHVRQRGVKLVMVPGVFDASRFNQVAVHGTFRTPHRIKLSLQSDDAPPVAVPGMATVTRRDEQVVLFDIPRLRIRDDTFNRLVLEIEGAGPGFQLRAVDLIDLPLGRVLADPEGSPELTDVGGVSQRGVGLEAGSPLVTDLTAEAGDRLQFAYGIPLQLRPPGSRPRLELLLESESGAREQRTYRFENARPGPAVWHEVTLSLEPFIGERVRARFTLDPGDWKKPLVCSVANLRVTRPGTQPPTVLLVTSDTHRADHVGAADLGVDVKTPALDALAARGVLFADCYSTTNVTTPSHVALMTGVHPRDTRVLSNSARTSEAATTLAERFREQGFTTLGVVSVRYLGPNGLGLGQGFDRMVGPERGRFSAEQSVNILSSWLDKADAQPLFIWLHVFDAHLPYEAPERFERLYYPEDKDPFDPSLPLIDAEPGYMPPRMSDVRDIEFPLAQYRAEISFLDEQLGRVLRHPRIRDAIVAVTADHGEILQKNGSYFNHGELFPDTLHVPLILSWPGAPRGRRVMAPVMQIDVGRTLLDLARVASVDCPGRNLLGALEGEVRSEPRFAISANSWSSSLMDGEWFLVLHFKDHETMSPVPRKRHAVELYRLATDPECLRDVAQEEPEQARRLRAQLVEWLGEAQPTGFAAEGGVSISEIQELVALGYATGEEQVREEEPWIDPACDCEECLAFR